MPVYASACELIPNLLMADPLLTPVGIDQAKTAHEAWNLYAPPTPDALFCSPLRRALRTCAITFPGRRVKVLEVGTFPPSSSFQSVPLKLRTLAGHSRNPHGMDMRRPLNHRCYNP